MTMPESVRNAKGNTSFRSSAHWRHRGSDGGRRCLLFQLHDDLIKMLSIGGMEVSPSKERQMILSNKPNIEISNIRYPMNKWRYLVLFQSAEQFASWLIIVLSITLLIIGAIRLAGDSLVPVEGIMLGTTGGSIFSLITVIKAEFIIKNCDSSFALKLESYLCTIRYVEEFRGADYVIYRQQLPRFLRWKEGNVKITFTSRTIAVTGGCFAIKLIHKSLCA